MKSEEALKARLRFLRRTHGQEPSSFEYSENQGRIEELHNAINDKPCEICNRLTEEFQNEYHRPIDEGLEYRNFKESCNTQAYNRKRDIR